MHIVVVVNVANPLTTIPRERLSKIFLREISTWDNGEEILPVDQLERSPSRIAFARDVQKQTVTSLNDLLAAAHLLRQ